MQTMDTLGEKKFELKRSQNTFRTFAKSPVTCSGYDGVSGNNLPSIRSFVEARMLHIVLHRALINKCAPIYLMNGFSFEIF